MKLDARIKFKQLFRHPEYGFRPYTRHSLVLIMGGLTYIALGIVITGWTTNGPRGSAIAIAFRVVPIDIWGVIWILVGGLVIFSAWWPAKNDRWGYAALTGMASCWAAIYLAGLFFEANSFSEITGALVWTMVAFMWWGIAGLMNPEDVVISLEPLEDPDGDGT